MKPQNLVLCGFAFFVGQVLSGFPSGMPLSI